MTYNNNSLKIIIHTERPEICEQDTIVVKFSKN